MTKAKALWEIVVNVANSEGQLVFIENIVNDLANVLNDKGTLPERREVRISHGTTYIAFTVYPVGDIGKSLVKLAGLMADPKHRSAFAVGAADFVDVEIEDIKADRAVGAKPGLLLSANGYPALILGGDPDRLILKMDGFDRAVIGLSAEVPGLWENVRREQGTVDFPATGAPGKLGPKTKKALQMLGNVKRMAALSKRQFLSSAAGILGLVLPAITIRPTVVSHDAAANLGGGALLVPIRGEKFTPGAYPSRPPVQILREGLGVQCVIAKFCLHELLGDETRAIELVEAGLPGTFGHFRDIGMEHLSLWTGFDDAPHLKTWATFQYANIQRTRRQDGMAHLINAALEPVQRLAAGLNHAQLIANAHDEAEKADAIKAGQILDRAYRDSRHSDCGFAALWDIARYGNIQPAKLWSVDNEAQVEVLELVRVLGRVEAGGEVLISPNVMRVLREGLNESFVLPEGDENLGPLVRHVVTELAQLLGRDTLERKLAKVRATGDFLLIERQSREMKVVGKQTAWKSVFRFKSLIK